LRFKAGLSFRKLDSALALDVIAKFKEKREPEVPEPSVHKEIKQKLLEIGNLQNHIAEEEYSFDLGKLDVVWRRVQQSVPTYVFEVHVRGDLYHDLAKLKHAFDLWNSHIFLVGNEADPDRISELTRGSFHEIKRHLKFISLAKVRELHARKKALINLETRTGNVTIVKLKWLLSWLKIRGHRTNSAHLIFPTIFCSDSSRVHYSLSRLATFLR